LEAAARARLAAMLALTLAACSQPPIAPTEDAFRSALASGERVVRLPRQMIEVSAEIRIPSGVEIDGNGAHLRATDHFRGRALIAIEGASRVRLRNFSIDGNRRALEHRAGLPPSNVPFSRFTPNNGILIERAAEVEIADLSMKEISGFAILVSASKTVRIDRVLVADSGSRNGKGRNNTTGGILFEEGSSVFDVRGCRFRNIRGNGLWTHSLYASPRNATGSFSGNDFQEIGRDALQAGHATRMHIERNTGRRIGFPASEVDLEGLAYPVAIDTAGNVDESVYEQNRFEEINGKCIDLDGFHHGKILSNVCVNRRPPEEYPHGNVGILFNHSNPDMESEQIVVEDNVIDGPHFTGIFVIGSDHRIVRNKLLNLNRARCNEDAAKFGCYNPKDEPDLLQSGIYLGRGTVHWAPVRNSVIQDNEITGFKMAERCIVAAPGVSLAENTIAGNRCLSTPPPPPAETRPSPTPR
jgi:hypothetical protein